MRSRSSAWENPDDLIGLAKEGDIVLVRGRGVLHKLLSCTSGISHCGVLYNVVGLGVWVSSMSLKRGRCTFEPLGQWIKNWPYVMLIRLHDQTHLDDILQFRTRCTREWKYSWLARSSHTYCTRHVAYTIDRSVHSMLPWNLRRLPHTIVYTAGRPFDTALLTWLILLLLLLLLLRL